MHELSVQWNLLRDLSSMKFYPPGAAELGDLATVRPTRMDEVRGPWTLVQKMDISSLEEFLSLR